MQTKSITLLFVLSLFMTTQCLLSKSHKSFLSSSTVISPSQANISILGTAANYAVLAASQTTNAGTTTIYGSLGTSPLNVVAGTAVTMYQGVFDVANTNSLNAQKDLTTAYNNLMGLPTPINKTGTDLVGLTLHPGVYKYNVACFLSAGILTLDAQGDANAQWAFQIGTTLITAVNSEVRVIGGGNPLNVYWQVGSSATIGGGTRMIGNIVAYASVSLYTNATLKGRALARTGMVAMLSNTIDATG